MKVPLADYSPDLDSFTPGILTDTNWVSSSTGGWTGMEPPAVASGGVLPSKCAGAYQDAILGKPLRTTLATYNQLYLYTGTGVTSQGLTLSNTKNEWSFDTYGNDTIAVNGVDPPQASLNGDPYKALPGSPPVASVVVATDYSLFLVTPNSQQYTFSLNDQIWTPSIATQTATATLSSTSGNIVAGYAMRGGILLFKQYSVFYGQFSGPPLFWLFVKVSETTGTPGLHSACVADTVCYFLGPDDFYQTDGFTLQAIPNHLRHFFFNDVDPAYFNNTCAIYDQQHKQIIWWYRSKNAPPDSGSGTEPPAGAEQPFLVRDRYVAFSLRTGRWHRGTVSVDSPLYGLSGQTLGYVDNLHQLNYLNGTSGGPVPYVSTCDLGDRTQIFRISRIRPRYIHYPIPSPNPLPQLQVWASYGAAEPNGPIASATITDFTGYFDLICANRAQRIKLFLTPQLEVADLDVEIGPHGSN